MYDVCLSRSRILDGYCCFPGCPRDPEGAYNWLCRIPVKMGRDLVVHISNVPVHIKAVSDSKKVWVTVSTRIPGCVYDNVYNGEFIPWFELCEATRDALSASIVRGVLNA